MSEETGSVRRQAELLARFDAHWLERLGLPLLAVGFSLSATALACDLLTFMIEAVRPSPWIALCAAIAAVEGVYGAQMREQANAPRLVGAGGIAFHLGLAYLLLRAAGFAAGDPVISTAALKRPEMYVPLGLVWLSYRLASTAGVRFVRIGSVVQSLGEQVAARLAWDQESVVSTGGLAERRESVTRFFAARTLVSALLGCILAAGAFDSFPEAAAAEPAWRWKVAAACACLLLFGLLLQAGVHLYRLRSIWDAAGVHVTAGVYERWLVLALLVVSAALLAGLAAPAFALFDFQATARRVSEILSGFFANGLEIFNRQVGGGRSERLGGWLPAPAPGGGAGNAAALFEAVPYVLLLALVVFVMGALTLLFLRSEWRKLPGLLRLPALSLLWLGSIGAIMARALFALFRRVRSAAAGRSLRLRAGDRAGGRSSLLSELNENRRAPAGSVRRYFARLVEEAALRGIRLKPHETAREFAAGLAATLGEVDAELGFLTDRYEDVRYGARPEGPGDEPPVARAFERVAARLAEWGRAPGQTVRGAAGPERRDHA